MSQSGACDVVSFCQRVKWGLLRVAGYVQFITPVGRITNKQTENRKG